MYQRIACTVVVSLLLILWPATPAVAEEEAKNLAYLEELFVFPDKSEEYEGLIREFKEVATTYGFPYQFNSYRLDNLRYLLIWTVPGTAGIDKVNTAWLATAEKWGEEASAAWSKKLFATMTHWESSVWTPRPDLAYYPENAADEFKFVFRGRLLIKLGHQQDVEEIFKEYIKLYNEHKVPHAWNTIEGYVGVENPTLAFIEWSASPGSYWMRQDEMMKDDEFSKKAEALWMKMLPHLREFKRDTGWYMEDMSYLPKKAEAAGEK